MPVPCLMNVSLDAGLCTGRIPIVFSVCFGGELGSLRAQKQRNRLQIHLLPLCQHQVIFQSIGTMIKANTLLVKVAPQKHDRIVVEANGFDPPPKAPFTESSCFCVGSQGYPVTEHEATDFGDASASIKEQPGHYLITLSDVLERELLPTFEDQPWKLGVINDARNPFISFQLVVIV